eukprot:m.821500 g.821500  ORF g.821500 m.821500 type:complete len:460 (-) comp59395_c0_seq70:1102-2481(-)
MSVERRAAEAKLAALNFPAVPWHQEEDPSEETTTCLYPIESGTNDVIVHSVKTDSDGSLVSYSTRAYVRILNHFQLLLGVRLTKRAHSLVALALFAGFEPKGPHLSFFSVALPSMIVSPMRIDVPLSDQEYQKCLANPGSIMFDVTPLQEHLGSDYVILSLLGQVRCFSLGTGQELDFSLPLKKGAIVSLQILEDSRAFGGFQVLMVNHKQPRLQTTTVRFRARKETSDDGLLSLSMAHRLVACCGSQPAAEKWTIQAYARNLVTHIVEGILSPGDLDPSHAALSGRLRAGGQQSRPLFRPPPSLSKAEQSIPQESSAKPAKRAAPPSLPPQPSPLEAPQQDPQPLQRSASARQLQADEQASPPAHPRSASAQFTPQPPPAHTRRANSFVRSLRTNPPPAAIPTPAASERALDSQRVRLSAAVTPAANRGVTTAEHGRLSMGQPSIRSRHGRRGTLTVS